MRRRRGRADACWPWLGYGTTGYGQLHIGRGRKVYAHRYSYELRHGPIPDGMVLDHLCRNRACVNPDHLEVVTLAENSRRAGQSSSGVGWSPPPRDDHPQLWSDAADTRSGA